MDYTNSHEKYLKELDNICVLKGFSNQIIKAYNYNVKRFLYFIDKSILNLDNYAIKSYLLTLN